MAPKKAAPKEEAAPPPEPEEEEELPRSAWVYGVNNHVERLSPEVVQAFSCSGHLREDYAKLCRKLGLVGHHELMPQVKGLPAPKELNLQSCLLDRASMLMLQVVLPSALSLSSLRLSGCSLDVELLQLLRQAFTPETSVQTLHVEWNRVELPLEPGARQRMQEAHHWSEIDEVERELEQRRARRSLLSFRDELELQGGSIPEAINQLAEKVVPGRLNTAILWPLDLQTWTSIFYDTFHMDMLDCEPIFNILDSDGAGDALVPLAKLQEVLEALPPREISTEERLLPPAQYPDVSDEIGSAFAAFLDRTSPLEMLSFRCCNLGRLEVQAIASALASPSPHLRALNLWGNKISDLGVQSLAEALEFNFGLEFLGLGRNFVTHVGMQSLCRVLGVTHLTDKGVAEKVTKSLKELQKDFEKKKKAFGPAPKDGNGRERHWPQPHLDTCEEFKDDEGNLYWLWARNTVLQTLNLEQNPISDVDAVEAVQPMGSGALILRSTPCAAALLAKRSEPEGEAREQKGWKLILS